MPEPNGRASRIARVSEDSDFTDRGHCGLGTFSVHIEGSGVDWDHPRSIYEVSVDEALAWANARASRVIVRYVAPEGQASVFTAGEQAARTNLEADGPIVDLPRWPPAGLSLTPGRNPGWEFTQRTARDEPIEWEVLLELYAVKDGLDSGAFVARLETVDGLVLLDWYDHRTDGPTVAALRARVGVSASTRDGAETIVTQAAIAAVQECAPEIGAPFSREEFAGRWWCEAFAFPAGTDVAKWATNVRPEV